MPFSRIHVAAKVYTNRIKTGSRLAEDKVQHLPGMEPARNLC